MQTKRVVVKKYNFLWEFCIQKSSFLLSKLFLCKKYTENSLKFHMYKNFNSLMALSEKFFHWYKKEGIVVENFLLFRSLPKVEIFTVIILA